MATDLPGFLIEALKRENVDDDVIARVAMQFATHPLYGLDAIVRESLQQSKGVAAYYDAQHDEHRVVTQEAVAARRPARSAFAMSSEGAVFRSGLKRLDPARAGEKRQRHVALYAPVKKRDVAEAWNMLARAHGHRTAGLAGYVDHEVERDGQTVRVIRVLRG